MSEDKELIAYCGLYCGDCYMYKGKIADLARDLRKELRQGKFGKRAEEMATVPYFAAFKNYTPCYELLGNMVKLRCKQACRKGGGPPMCQIRQCCQKKGIDGCWQCDDFEICKTIDFLKKFHEDGHIKNMKIIRKSGIDSFLHSKRYW